MSRDTARTLPELRPVELLVLVELIREDRHGYGIVQAVEESSGGAVSLVPGNLYRVLYRLIDRGFIKELDGRSQGRRRIYRITAAGRAEARREIERLEALTTRARARIQPTR